MERRIFLAVQGRGVKKIGENVLEKGRAIIVTDKDKNNYKWAEIPDGSKFIDTKTGIESVKLEGQTDWVPGGLKNDGTLCIAKDTMQVREIFTIIDPDESSTTFSCLNENNEVRHYFKNEYGFVFQLEKGSYQMERNQVEVIIDDVLHRSAASGGVAELSETRIALNDKLQKDQEITIIYSNVIRIGNPYPRFFINQNEPDKAEIGDFWLDTDATLEENDYLGAGIGDADSTKTIPWNRVTHKPTTLSEYHLKQEVQDMIDNHRIDASMIDNATNEGNNYIDAHSVQGHIPGLSPNNIFLIPANGKIPLSMIDNGSEDNNNVAMTADVYIGNTPPIAPKNNLTVWFCTSPNNLCAQVYSNGQWVRMGAAWQ